MRNTASVGRGQRGVGRTYGDEVPDRLLLLRTGPTELLEMFMRSNSEAMATVNCREFLAKKKKKR